MKSLRNHRPRKPALAALVLGFFFVLAALALTVGVAAQQGEPEPASR